MLGAGKYNKRGVIEHLVTGSPAKNELGEPNETWEELATVWMAIEPVSGREFWAQQQVQSEVTARIRIRYRNDIDPGMRIVYLGKYYMVVSVIDYQMKHDELQLMCAEGVRNG